MILTPLADASRYAALAPGIEDALRWLCAWDPELPDGRHPIEGDEVFATVASYATSPATDRRWEAHRRYLDVQWVASGVERILYAPSAALVLEQPYDEESDLVFFRDPGPSSSLLLRTGDVALFGPADAHKPGCMAGGRDAVRKVVVKVRIGTV